MLSSTRKSHSKKRRRKKERKMDHWFPILFRSWIEGLPMEIEIYRLKPLCSGKLRNFWNEQYSFWHFESQWQFSVPHASFFETVCIGVSMTPACVRECVCVCVCVCVWTDCTLPTTNPICAGANVTYLVEGERGAYVYRKEAVVCSSKGQLVFPLT